ncbi:hypothetical protein JHK82_035022 [Glycine max]|nr:hypothetical protein JHK85_035760 [Glycine max]KAG4975645.1 hypothetical protein JHK86_035119 [Glycine max]KAG5111753.1 hypothetical protein JHK82_035022 [Glycine max]KAG5129035.1 hypothetical protein JHK84_035432 [Glycine max]
MGTSPHQKDEGGVRHTSAAATLDDVVDAIKHLTQTLENMDNQNRTRLDAIENTNHTMLKAICNFVRQDQHESTKDAMDDVAMSGTQNTCVNDQRLSCENPKKPVSTPTVKSTKNEAYSKLTGSFKNIETIFIPGDDDDEFIKPLPMGMKGSKSSYSSLRTLNLSGPNQVNTTDNSSPPEPFMSNYVTGLTAKAKNTKETLMAPRKLSFPQHSYRTSKKPKIEQHSKHLNAKKMQQTRGSSSGNMTNNNQSRMFHRSRTTSNRGYTHTIPKDMPCCFKPIVDMNLTFEETQIILFMCLKVAYSQLYRTRSVWCMPPAFAVDVINGSPVETLIEHYGKDWMPPFSDLKLIYIPIIQNSAHWYLMVIDMNDRNIYHLDCDLTSQAAYQRKDTIKIMANVMLSVLEIVFPTQEFVIGFDGMDCWDIIEARGIPNCGSSEKSTLWVLEWMQMEESFVSLLYGVLEEKAVRMKVAMILLLGTHNQCRGELITNAERNWHDSIHGKH